MRDLHRLSRVLCAVLGLLTVGAQLCPAAAPDRLDFNRDVRPILSDTCFKCHGPDASKREAELSLNTRKSAITARDSGPAIVPGKPDESEAVRRVFSSGDDRMPPPDSGLTLSSQQQETIRRWIEQGAEYQQHWSLTAPKTPPLPEVSAKDWCRSGIDNFVLKRLQQEGLEPSPPAEKETLIRRVTLDLTGLPPTLSEVDAFLADGSPDAYEKLVDRLLDSPHFGERMAQVWLDAARYADTSGYQADWERHMWPWRDWVVRAYNDNMPFDRFTIEQIAGDMLPDATLDQRLATGFNRNHRINDEGGIIPEEYAVEYVVDRVDTTSTVWLGLTIGCARCHDHKYDPITQKEFYQLYAYFNNVAEKGQDGRAGFAAPFIRVARPEDSKEIERLERDAAELEAQLAAETPESTNRQVEWEAQVRRYRESNATSIWSTAEIMDADATGGPILQVLDDESVVAQNISPDKTAYELVLKTSVPGVTALRLDVLTDESLPDGRLGRGDGNFILSEFEAEITSSADAKPRMLKFASAAADYSQTGHPIAHAVDGKPATGWSVDGDLLRGARTAVFTLSDPIAEQDSTIKVRLKQGGKQKQQTIGRLKLLVTSAPSPQIEPLELVPADILTIVGLAPAARSQQQARELAEYFRSVDPQRKQLREQIIAVRRQALNVTAAGIPVMVMQEMPRRRDTYVLRRGQYDQPDKKQQVGPGIPVALVANSSAQPQDRLEFARWLVSAENPLTARVAVNRYWQMYFGAGLVKTSEDFGSQGEPPSHPELLDYLATEFIRSGWDVKAMQKLIVTSATYRQSSKISAALLERDPENRLLARGPRLRLDAHAIRDNALAVSGLLVKQLGGAPVKPYQPAGLWEELSFNNKTTVDSYQQDTGDKLYRRSLYTFWKRTAPSPSMVIFDAAGREACSVRLGRTNTPLQALNLLNDVTYVEAARALAERMMHEGGASPADRISHGWRLTMARRPAQAELATLLRGLDSYLAKYHSDPAAAQSLVTFGESPRDAQLDPPEHAAYTAVGNVLLNLDETVTKE